MILLVTFVLAAAAKASSSLYVSVHGNDLASGTSPTEAWRTLARASNHTYSSGDQLLLERSSFWLDDPLRVDVAAAGGVRISSYGNQS